jgi:hypothetical protein
MASMRAEIFWRWWTKQPIMTRPDEIVLSLLETLKYLNISITNRDVNEHLSHNEGERCWPEYCFLPLSEWASIMHISREDYTSNELIVLALQWVMTIYTWRYSRGYYPLVESSANLSTLSGMAPKNDHTCAGRTGMVFGAAPEKTQH